MLDLRPTAQQVADLVAGVADDALGGPTPCDGTTVGQLVDHVATLSLAFKLAAAKEAAELTGPPPPPDASRLGQDWRRRVPEQVLGLAEAWREPLAWQGMTHVGGLDLPGEEAGTVALDELVLHGWDLAVATDQPFAPTPAAVEACTGFVEMMAAPEHLEAREGLFGPVLPVPADATPLERLLRLSGRDPAWRVSVSSTPRHVGLAEAGAVARR